MRAAWLQQLALLAMLWPGPVRADNSTLPVAQPFLSRPDIITIVLNVTVNQPEKVSPGYIFLAPYQITQSAPLIFDMAGNLIWTGWAQSGPAPSHDFHVCVYDNADHLCMFQGDQALGFARGNGVILDKSYRPVQTVQAGGNVVGLDQHEFNVINGGKSALVTAFQPVAYDLTPWINGTAQQGYIMEGIMQEIDVASGAVLYEWRSLDHVSPSASFVLPGTTDVSGNGSAALPWDYFHINSADKNDAGDYLISSRHTKAIYKLSAADRSVLWTLGGNFSDFTQNFNFSFQHDARFVSDNATTTVLSFYDNAYDGYNQSADYSTGKIVALDHTNKSATLLHEYNAHQLSSSQGNLQQLPDGNVFLGHGSAQVVSEMTGDGELVYQAHFATTGALQYRSYKFNFSSTPRTTPSLYAYAANSSAPVAAYVSWNGATDVASWRFFAGADPSAMQYVGSVARSGFETTTLLPQFAAYVFAEARADNGTSLANSTFVATFVPGAALAAQCNELQCPILNQGLIAPGLATLLTNVSSIAPTGSVSAVGLAAVTASASATTSTTTASSADRVVVGKRAAAVGAALAVGLAWS